MTRIASKYDLIQLGKPYLDLGQYTLQFTKPTLTEINSSVDQDAYTAYNVSKIRQLKGYSNGNVVLFNNTYYYEVEFISAVNDIEQKYYLYVDDTAGITTGTINFYYFKCDNITPKVTLTSKATQININLNQDSFKVVKAGIIQAALYETLPGDYESKDNISMYNVYINDNAVDNYEDNQLVKYSDLRGPYNYSIYYNKNYIRVEQISNTNNTSQYMTNDDAVNIENTKDSIISNSGSQIISWEKDSIRIKQAPNSPKAVKILSLYDYNTHEEIPESSGIYKIENNELYIYELTNSYIVNFVIQSYQLINHVDNSQIASNIVRYKVGSRFTTPLKSDADGQIIPVGEFGEVTPGDTVYLTVEHTKFINIDDIQITDKLFNDIPNLTIEDYGDVTFIESASGSNTDNGNININPMWAEKCYYEISFVMPASDIIFTYTAGTPMNVGGGVEVVKPVEYATLNINNTDRQLTAIYVNDQLITLNNGSISISDTYPTNSLITIRWAGPTTDIVKKIIKSNKTTTDSEASVKVHIYDNDYTFKLVRETTISIEVIDVQVYYTTLSNKHIPLNAQYWEYNNKILNNDTVPKIYNKAIGQFCYIETQNPISTCSSVFKGQTDLKTIKVLTENRIIENSAFANCTGLRKFAFGHQNDTTPIADNELFTVGQYSFKNCILTEFESFANCTSIGKYAFEGSQINMFSPTDKHFQDSQINRLEAGTFKNCKKLDSIILPTNIKYIGTKGDNTEIFEGSNLTDVAWNIKKTKENEYAIRNNSPFKSLASKINNITFGDKVEQIDDYLCATLNKIQNITIPKSNKHIGKNAFYKCSNLATLIIENATTQNSSYYIDERAFAHCTSLNNVEFPHNSVTHIQSEAFYKSLSSNVSSNVTFGRNICYIGESAFAESGVSKITFSMDRYTSHSSTFIIDDKAFYSCKNLSYPIVIPPKSVTHIGDSAFEHCDKLTLISLGESVKTIGSQAFYKCSKLTTITTNSVNDGNYIGPSLTTIGNHAFDGVNASTAILNPSLVELGSLAFANCPKLQYVKWEATRCSLDNLTNIDDPAEWTGYDANTKPFYNSTSKFTTLDITNNVEYIPSYVFAGCNKIQSKITMPECIKHIGEYAFSNCEKLDFTSGDWANTYLEIIGQYSFYNCKGITTDITLPSSVQLVDKRAFSNCHNIVNVSLSRNMQKISVETFYNSDKLTNVYINSTANIKEICDSAFEGCQSLEFIKIPAACTSIGTAAFKSCHRVDFKDRLKVLCGTPANPLKTTDASYKNANIKCVVPDNVIYIGNEAFHDTHWWMYDVGVQGPVYINRVLYKVKGYPSTHITLHQNTISISPYAFRGLTYGMKVVLNYGLKYIHEGAFYNSNIIGSMMVSTYNDSYNTLNINNSVWDKDYVLVIPASVEYIGPNCFYDCGNIYHVVIRSANITTLHEGTFSNIRNTKKPNEGNIRSFTFMKNITKFDNAISGTFSNENKTDERWRANTDNVFYYGTIHDWLNIDFINCYLGGNLYCLSTASSTTPTLVTSLTITSGYSKVKQYSLMDNKSLTSVKTDNIAELTIEDHAFNRCQAASYDFSKCSKLIVSYRSFFKCPGTFKFNTVHFKGESSAFERCTNLTTINLHTDTTQIPSHTFYHCNKLVSINNMTSSAAAYTLQQISYIGKYALADTALTAFYLTNSACTIDNNAFEMCKSLTRLILTVNTIGMYAFYECTALNKGTNDGTVRVAARTFNPQCFYGCSSIKQIDITAINIKAEVFKNCSGLTTVTFNKHIDGDSTKISSSAFTNCKNISSITLNTHVMADYGNNKDIFKNSKSVITSVIIKSNATHISPEIFEGYSNITTLDLSNATSLVNIYEEAFKDCTGIKSALVFPATLYIIYSRAFENCSQIPTVDFSRCTSLEYIYGEAFKGCSNISQTINFSNTILQYLGVGAFEDCSKITTVNLQSASLNYIGEDCFNGCTNLSSVAFDLTCPLQTIYVRTFKDTKISSIKIPKKVKLIKSDAFKNCTSLTTVYLPKSLTKIEDYAFTGCDALTTVYYEGTSTEWNTLKSNSQSAGNSKLFNCNNIKYNWAY